MFQKKIESIAENILASQNIKEGPVPVELIASQNSIQISRAPNKDFSGLLIRKEGKSLIGINNNESPKRQRFTIAHELGHYFLHPNKNAFVDYRDNQKNIKRGIKEVQANIFAAALLMPKAFLEKDYKEISKKGLLEEDDLKYSADKYQVSEDAMKIRLINLRFS